MKFYKRVSEPDKTNVYYLRPDRGYNKCIRGNTKHGLNHGTYDVLPNCTGWCYGRFLECQDLKSCKLPTSNAETWLNKNKTYQEGWTARVGAILVFGKGKVGEGKDGAGHVIFTEGIAKDGTVLGSESGWGFTKSRMDTRKVKRNSKGAYIYKAGYTYLGCIYPEANFETAFYGELPTKALSYGMKGTQVKRLQDFLNWCLGTKLQLDGHYGPATRDAVKAFQKLYKLDVDGKFGPKCIAKAKTIKL